MTTIYHDADADLAALDGQTVAVVGYGNQGRSQALNLRDSGVSVVIGNIRDAAHEAAEADGFPVQPIGDACASADVVMLLIPDEVMPEVYREQIAPRLREGALVVFASGYNVAFGQLEVDPHLDVALIAPRMIGVGVRDAFVAGRGYPAFVGVHQDASGSAKPRMLALCKGLGATRGGCIEMTLHDEASLDLFTEQGFGPAWGRVLMSAAELLVEAGYPPEAVLVELYLSGELAYTLEKIREVGMTRQMDFHSRTSQYGSITRGARYLGLDPALKEKMGEVLGEIRDGTFAKEWSEQQEQASAIFEQIRAVRDELPFTKWEASARTAFGIGSSEPDGSA
ncbi:MAG: ketol-acid reductoisomerase [Myxococcota bacterium]